MPPGGSALVDFPVKDGRWLPPDDDAGVVLGHNAARGTPIGAPITLSVDGRRSTWTVIGTVEEIGGSSAFLGPPPFTVSTSMLVAWSVAVIAGRALASSIPARRAARLSVRAGLA